MIRKEGSDALLIAGDIGDKSFCDRVVAETIDKFGRLDVVVNNAGEQHSNPDFTNVSEEQIERTFRTNIFGQFFLVQAALPHLAKGATIIGVTSITAYRGQDLLLDYASTKGAILSFVRALSSKLAPEGIRVNGVAPGPIWTPFDPGLIPKG